MPADGKTEMDKVKDADSKDKKEGDGAKKEEKKVEPPKDPKTLLADAICANLKAIHSALSAGDSRQMGRVVRALGSLRRKMLPDVLLAFLKELIDEKTPHKATFLAYLPAPDVVMKTEDGQSQAWELKFPASFTKPYPVEFEAFGNLLLLVWLMDRKEDDKAFECANTIIEFSKGFNRRSLDLFTSRAYFYLSLVYERKGRLPELRMNLLAAYRTACLRRDVMGQATLLNLLLRNYLSNNLYEQALKLVSKTTFPESRPNAQYARYLFYIGQIKAVQLEYSDAHSKLMQAIRKAPQSPNVALGFKITAYKWAITVELLMGGIPDRSTFTQKELWEQLRPYHAVTQAVRSGDLNEFKTVMQKHEALFKKDKTLTLMHRLRYNVIKTGLRSINLAYSRISLQDICAKLGLESPQDAAGIVAKAVVDGVIDATIDYDKQYLSSKKMQDLYTSCEPQKAFHKRIAFCLQMHNDAVKAMAYPEETNKDGETAEERREREKQQLADVDDDGDDDDMGLL